MPMNKPHLEFVELDMDDGGETPEGYPDGIGGEAFPAPIYACHQAIDHKPEADKLKPAMVKGRDTAVAAYRFPSRSP